MPSKPDPLYNAALSLCLDYLGQTDIEAEHEAPKIAEHFRAKLATAVPEKREYEWKFAMPVLVHREWNKCRKAMLGGG